MLQITSQEIAVPEYVTPLLSETLLKKLYNNKSKFSKMVTRSIWLINKTSFNQNL